MPNVQKGTKRAEEITEENKSSAFYRVRTAAMKDGEGPWYYRIITPLDDMITADMHTFCDTKPKPEEYTGDKWPAAMPAGCRNDRMFRILSLDGTPTDVFEEGYGQCYIHDRDRGTRDK